MRADAIVIGRDDGFGANTIARTRGENALRAMMDTAVLIEPSPAAKPGRIVATYDYQDEAGTLLYQVTRHEPKTFRQRRPNGNGGWIPNLDGVRRVLYRLPELIEDTAQGRAIYIVEGEKDADNLRQLGIPATTCPQGAGKWRAEYSETLRGADVVVLPDNDGPGRKHAAAVAASLAGIASRVRVLDLAVHWPDMPAKGDVSDWLAAGGTVERLAQIAEQTAEERQQQEEEPPPHSDAPPWGEEEPQQQEAPKSLDPTPFAWIDPAELPPRAWLYGKHYIRKYLTCTVAPGGGGKTSLAIVEALAMATGRPLLGIKPERRMRVWYWNGEDPADELQRRIIAAMIQHGIKPEDVAGHLFVDNGREKPITLATLNKQGAQIARPVVDAVIAGITRNGIDVLIVDPFVKSHKVAESDNMAIDAVASEWAAIADVTNSSIELDHHPRKTGGHEITVDDSRGAGALINAARSVRLINKMSKQEAGNLTINEGEAWRYFRVDSGKANMAPPAEHATWHKLETVTLANGDHVGAATAWTPTNPFDGLKPADLRAAQKAVAEGGPWRASPKAKAWVGIPIAKALGLDPEKDKRRITLLLKTWIENGMFKAVKGKGEDRHLVDFVEVGTWAD